MPRPPFLTSYVSRGLRRPAGRMAFYVGVDDLSAYEERVKEAGGKIVVERMEVPGVGVLSLFEDPDGRVLGMWQHVEAD